MNRKGFGFPSIFVVFVLIFVVIILAMGQNNMDTSTIDKTINSLNWSKYYQNISISLQSSASSVHEGSGGDIMKVIINILDKGIDFFGYGVIEVTKLAMKLAKDNPDIINYKVLLALVLLSLLMPILYYGFLAFIVVFLLIREWVQNRKEKKKLNELKVKNKT